MTQRSQSHFEAPLPLSRNRSHHKISPINASMTNVSGLSQEVCRLKQRLSMEEEVILGTYLNKNLVFTTLKAPTRLQLLEGGS